MARRQRELGLDRLPLANGGRAVEVFRSGAYHVDGRVDEDPVQFDAVKWELGVRSVLECPLDVVGERRGVLLAASSRPEHFSEDDVPFFGAVARWIGLVIHRAELIEQVVGNAEARGRREVLVGMLDRLTPRRREISALIAGGLTYEQIGVRLVLTPGTVANHVEHILRRLDLGSRVEVATLVAELGLHRQHANGHERAC